MALQASEGPWRAGDTLSRKKGLLGGLKDTLATAWATKDRDEGPASSSAPVAEQSGWRSTLKRFRRKPSHAPAETLFPSGSPIVVSQSCRIVYPHESPTETNLRKTKSTPRMTTIRSPNMNELDYSEESMFKNPPLESLKAKGPKAPGPVSLFAPSPLPHRLSRYMCGHEGCSESFARFYQLNTHVLEAHGQPGSVLVAPKGTVLEPEYREERLRMVATGLDPA